MSEPEVWIDKSTWGDGPWQTEPDKVVWIDDATNLDCMIHRGPGGQWCGYVGVDRTHPWYRKDYDAVDVDVHGGLTYADVCNEDIDICHVPGPGRSGDLWWFGFDCAHAWDYAPAMEARWREFARRKGLPDEMGDVLLPGAVYRDMAYVQAETRHLAEQLAEVVTQPDPSSHSDCHSTGHNPPPPLNTH